MLLPIKLSEQILEILSTNYNKKYTLEDLASIIMLKNNACSEKACQAKVLDTLIVLDDEGFIILDPDTDESRIATNGVMK